MLEDLSHASEHRNPLRESTVTPTTSDVAANEMNVDIGRSSNVEHVLMDVQEQKSGEDESDGGNTYHQLGVDAAVTATAPDLSLIHI